MIVNASRIEQSLLIYTDLVSQVWPAFFYFPVLIRNPDIVTFINFVLSIVTGLLFFLLLLNSEDLRQKKLILTEFLNKFHRCEFIVFDLTSYFGKKPMVLEELSYARFNFLGRLRNVDTRRNVKVVAVKRGKSKKVPSKIVSFPTFMSGPSYVFIRDFPEEISTIGKFYLFHELGHCSWRSSITRYTTQIGLKLFYMPLIYVLFIVRIDLVLFFLLLGYGLLIFGTRRSFKASLKYKRYIEEMSADRFAVDCLSENERIDLSFHVLIGQRLPTDSQLEGNFNYQRWHNLISYMYNLEKKKKKRKKESTIYLYPINSNRALYTFAILTPMIGIFAKPGSGFLICLNFLFLLGIFSILLWQEFAADGVQEQINKVLISSKEKAP